jgi:hypothetical protein
MLPRIAVSLSLLLCVAATAAFAQVRRPTRTPTGKWTPPTPLPALTMLTLSHDSISGGPGTLPNGKVTLSGPAPAGGLAVAVTSDNAVATVPPSVVVAAGATEATFQVSANLVTTPTLVRITARAGTATMTDSLKVLLSVVSVLTQNAGRGPWTVTLSGPAPPNGIRVTAHLVGNPGSGHACWPIPVFSSPVIPGGQTSGVVTAQAGPSMQNYWDWQVTYRGRSSAPLKFIVGPPGLVSVDLPATLVGGTSGNGFVRLTGPTPSYGCATSAEFASAYDKLYIYYFSSNSAVIQVPSTARVDPHQSERLFAVTASAVQSPQTATITVSHRNQYGGPIVAIKQVTISVTP